MSNSSLPVMVMTEVKKYLLMRNALMISKLLKMLRIL